MGQPAPPVRGHTRAELGRSLPMLMAAEGVAYAPTVTCPTPYRGPIYRWSSTLILSGIPLPERESANVLSHANVRCAPVIHALSAPIAIRSR
jgi:hypothetical protein